MKQIEGFTLLELVIVLAIVGLILGGVIAPLSTQLNLNEVKQENESLESIKEALIGYAITNGRLPCPDTNNDGVAEPSCVTGSVITTVQGALPNITVGVSRYDTWGREYIYAVSSNFTQARLPNSICSTTDNYLGLCVSGGITIQTRLTDSSLQTVITDAPAVIVSLGANGSGGVDINGNTMASPVGTDELDNITFESAAPITFTIRDFSKRDASSSCNDTGSELCPFDDRLIWISPNILKNRMVQAGRLP